MDPAKARGKAALLSDCSGTIASLMRGIFSTIEKPG
jgi:hypothetical protein